MVATVGSISIDLSTNAAKFSTGFKNAATTVETQSSRMAKSISALERNTALAAGTLKSLGTGLAAGAGLAALSSLGGAFDKLKQTISEYDEIATNAKTTGLNTDTYQALAFAAQKANISQESYNSALSIFAKNAGLAAVGQGALYSGLKNLNPQLLQNILNTKDQEERLKLVADAMAQTSDATEKAALSAAIFGKGGVEISRILEDGRKSIDDFKESARKLGIIIPADLLKRGQELDDILDDLAKVIHVQLGEALINLAPFIVSTTTDFANLSKEVNGISKAITDFTTNPSVAKFRELLSQITGLTIIPGSFADDVVNGMKLSNAEVAALTASLDFMEKKLAELKVQAEQGYDVHIEIAEAVQSIDELKTKIGGFGAVVGAAAKAISTGFAQAFREAENASMEALARMNGGGALPTVHRFGGDPNQIDLPTKNSSYNSNVNGSGVGVRSFGGDPNAKNTADNTQTTADNVSSLDTNTKGYLKSLSSDIGGYSAQQISQQSIVINKLSDVTASTAKYLSTSILAALVQKNDTADGSIPNNGFLTHDQVFIPGMSHYGGNVGHIEGWDSEAGGTSSTSVNVQQPGNNYTLNYTAAPGESEQTARQRARDMYDELTLQAARA